MQKLLRCFSVLLFPAFAFAQAPSGSVAHYLMDGDLNDAGGNGYNGTSTGITPTNDRFGNANKATSFTQGVSSGTLPGALQVSIQKSFSFSFWLRTSMNASSSTQWFGGSALVDAEVCGGTSDWGIALIDGGKVCFGIGGADFTIKSTLNYNDGNWHFVTASRDQAAGSITLSVNGVTCQNGDVAHMIWNVAEIISKLSNQYELRGGDIILTGTPAGVGPIVPGDVVDCAIAGLGRIGISIGPPAENSA